MGEPAVEPLINALQDEDKNVRMLATSALGKIKDPRAIQPLVALMGDEDVNVRQNSNAALGEIGAPAVESLITALQADNREIREAQGSGALAVIKDPRAIPGLIDALSDWKLER